MKDNIKAAAYMQCGGWVLPCATVVPFPKLGQVLAAMANQAVDHEAVCAPLSSARKECKVRSSFELRQQSSVLTGKL